MAKKIPLSIQLILLFSIIFVIIGLGLFLYTTETITGKNTFWGLFALIIGVSSIFITTWKNLPYFFVFFSSLFSLSVIVKLFALIFKFAIVQYWPLFSIAAGISFILTALLLKRKIKVNLIVCSSCLFLLGVFLSVFSFGFSSISFGHFIRRCWPLFFIGAGIILFLVWNIKRASYKFFEKDSKNEVRSIKK